MKVKNGQAGDHQGSGAAMGFFSKLFGNRQVGEAPVVPATNSAPSEFIALEGFGPLEHAPRTTLAAYLQLLARLLEDAVALKFGFFRQNKIGAEDVERLSQAIQKLANQALQHALKVRPEEVLRWLQQLNDLQKPTMIDFTSWDLLARQSPTVIGGVEVPSPTNKLAGIVESIRATHPEWLGGPTPIDHLQEVIERKGQIPTELLSFYRLANSLSAELGSYRLDISPLKIDRRQQDCGITLWHKFTSRNPWVYHYGIQADGSIAQTSWFRLNDPAHKLERPEVVAGSLEEFLATAVSPGRLRSGLSKWSPGPLLPVAGDKPASKPKKAQSRQINRAPGDVCSAIRNVIDLKMLKNPINFLCSSEPPGLEEIRSLEKTLGAKFPAEYVEFVRLYGAVRVEAKEEVWPRPKIGDLGPAWGVEYAVAFFGLGTDVPESDQIANITRQFLVENEDDEDLSRLVPCCSVDTSGDYYCFDGDGGIVFLPKGASEPEASDLDFIDLFEREVDRLIERTRDKAQAK